MHNRLCHGSDYYLTKTQPIVDGFPATALAGKCECDSCAEGKDHRQPITRDPGRAPRKFEPGEAVAMDTTREMPPSIQGGTVMNVCINRGSVFITGQLLVGKTSATMAKAFLRYIVKQGRPDFWYGDGGPEYQDEFEDLETLVVTVGKDKV